VSIQHQPSSAQLAPSREQQRADALHAAGSHWVRAEERKGKTVPDWEWMPGSTVKRIAVCKARQESHACAMCGKDFIPARADAKYCGSRCRLRAYRIRAAQAVIA
jgi:hypothetical protein